MGDLQTPQIVSWKVASQRQSAFEAAAAAAEELVAAAAAAAVAAAAAATSAPFAAVEVGSGGPEAAAGWNPKQADWAKSIGSGY